jgi:hypothetical protein
MARESIYHADLLYQNIVLDGIIATNLSRVQQRSSNTSDLNEYKQRTLR